MRHSWSITPSGIRRAAIVAAALWSAFTVAALCAPAALTGLLHTLADARPGTAGLAGADGALGLGAAVALIAGRRVRGRGDLGDELAAPAHAVQAIVDAHGEDSLAPFIVRPDKQVALHGDTAIAYRRIGGTLVVSGDPVGPADRHAEALAALRERCADAGLGVVVYGAGPTDLEIYRRAGMRAICVGEESIVDPAGFSLEGRAVRKVRQSVARVGKRGWTVTAVEGRAVDDALADEIDAVERRWRAEHPRMLGFAMSFGAHEHGARPDDLLLLGRAPDGELRAVMRFLAHRGNLSLDTMRRIGETPNGLNEALVCRVLAIARERGVTEVSLNYAGLAHLRHDPGAGGLARRLLRRGVLRVCGRFFQLERLVCFNEKFGPVWRPRYLVYESRAALPTAILRVLQAEGYVAARSEHRRGAERPAPLNRSALAEPRAQR